MTATHRTTITRLGQFGDGIAQTDVGPLIVPGALPGEEVEGAVAEGRMEAPRILTPAPERIRPPCPHAKACGGCVTQHASDALVAAWKRDLLRDALRAQGLDPVITKIETSPPNSRRRARFAGRRTKKGALVGFHGARSHVITEVPNCTVITKPLQDLLPHLREITLAGASRKGEIAFQATETEGGADLDATGGRPLDLTLRQTLVELGAAAGLARLTWNGEPVAEWAPPLVRFGPARVALPPGAFLQATAHGQAVLTQAVEDITAPAKRIADLFCGCGTFALPLSARADILGVESAPAQTAALEAAWRARPGLHQLQVETRDLFRRPLEPDELARFDAVVIDPPRAGAAAQTACLAQSAVERIAFVSCAPNTFARDAARLIAAGFTMGPITLVDQFRWSPHLELVAGFTRT